MESGPFQALVFTRSPERTGHHYFADVDNGIRCVRAPCPSTSRQEGPYTVTSTTLTLSPADPRLGVVLPTNGTFQYTLRGTVLTLSRDGHVVARLTKAPSYCAEADDCAEQGLSILRCPGAFACTDARVCEYRCTSPVSHGEGTVCGGFAGIRCDTGLTCVLAGDYPDAAGTCRLVGPRCGDHYCESGSFCCSQTSGVCVMPGGRCPR